MSPRGEGEREPLFVSINDYNLLLPVSSRNIAHDTDDNTIDRTARPRTSWYGCVSRAGLGYVWSKMRCGYHLSRTSFDLSTFRPSPTEKRSVHSGRRRRLGRSGQMVRAYFTHTLTQNSMTARKINIIHLSRRRLLTDCRQTTRGVPSLY